MVEANCSVFERRRPVLSDTEQWTLYRSECWAEMRPICTTPHVGRWGGIIVCHQPSLMGMGLWRQWERVAYRDRKFAQISKPAISAVSRRDMRELGRFSAETFGIGTEKNLRKSNLSRLGTANKADASANWSDISAWAILFIKRIAQVGVWAKFWAKRDFLKHFSQIKEHNTVQMSITQKFWAIPDSLKIDQRWSLKMTVCFNGPISWPEGHSWWPRQFFKPNCGAAPSVLGC